MSKNPTKYDIKPCPDCGATEFPLVNATKFMQMGGDISRTVSFECPVCGYYSNEFFSFKDCVNEWNIQSNKQWNPSSL